MATQGQDLRYSMYFAGISVLVGWLLLTPLGPDKPDRHSCNTLRVFPRWNIVLCQDKSEVCQYDERGCWAVFEGERGLQLTFNSTAGY